MQLCVKVAKDNTGFIRLWIDDTLIAEQSNTRTLPTSRDGLGNWGIGDYWNSVPYISDPNDDSQKWFFIDEVIIASDLPGYGAPTTVDSNGYPYIIPSLRVADLAA
ncbi:hypothetical protein J057_01740 [Marinobacter nanhaiticus D15-8W]|uniref:Uncharacterized protein n=4 Tax=Marinobacter TaxID=2742 RepID=N6X736_9GAMM|nr:hypothetical protein J057_01740 [Marinobacter nanhaiticus D15-8W]